MARGWTRPGLPVGTQRHELTIIGDRQKIVIGDDRYKYKYPCRCSCGNTALIANTDFGRTKTCGCLRKEMLPKRNFVHGGRKTKLYGVWCSMRNRCVNPNRHNSHRYVGRGVTVCDAWNESFSSFRDWACSHGYEEGLQLDRINNDGNYEPNNCRWVTSRQNNNNRRGNRIVVCFGEYKTIAEWARDARCQVSMKTLNHRISDLHWPPEKAITLPRQ